MEKQKEETLQFVTVVASIPKREKPLKESIGKKIVLETLLSKGKYFEVVYVKVQHKYKSCVAGARALGRIIKNMKLDQKLVVFAQGNSIWIEKLEQKKKEK